MSAKFGPAGSGDSFKALGYKSSLQIPEYLTKIGLDCFEYQCGRGVNIGSDKAKELGKIAKEQGIGISLHAPYYISMSSVEEEKRLNSVNYILASAKAVNDMGGDRIIVHTGSCGKIPRETALELAIDTMRIALNALKENGLSHIHICPETMGKVNQLGTLNEVIELCKIDDSLIPCIDFGHLNARELGILKTKSDFEKIFLEIKDKLGEDRLKVFHSHFSKIEYSQGGEKRHLTFEDNIYGPDFEPCLDLCIKYGCSPTFICESAGTQAEDAKQMKDYYTSISKI
ncbi:MAG: TIM barrel protein [Clostridia bacterium]|nr:TIM barrel protein [Clostridia bacterium]